MNALKTNQMRCRLAIVFCSLLSFLVFLAVSDQLLSTPDAIVQEVGWKSYHMFTILANMFMGIGLMLVPAYQLNESFPGSDYLFLKLDTSLFPANQYIRACIYAVLLILIFHAMWFLWKKAAGYSR